MLQVQVTHPLTAIKSDSFYDPTTCPTHWGADDGFGPPSGVDGDPNTFIHTSVWEMTRHQYIVDNDEIRAITRVRLQARPDCCWERDSPVQIWVGNNPADATAPGNVMCVMAPPFTGLGTWREFTCTRASFLARYVFVLLDCNGALPCIMNWANVAVFALQPTWPLIYKEVAQGKPADMITPCCAPSPTTVVATWAVDGNTRSITHTGAAIQGVLWWQVDLGSFVQPIDRGASPPHTSRNQCCSAGCAPSAAPTSLVCPRLVASSIAVWLLGRAHYINCIRYVAVPGSWAQTTAVLCASPRSLHSLEFSCTFFCSRVQLLPAGPGPGHRRQQQQHGPGLRRRHARR